MMSLVPKIWNLRLTFQKMVKYVFLIFVLFLLFTSSAFSFSQNNLPLVALCECFKYLRIQKTETMV